MSIRFWIVACAVMSFAGVVHAQANTQSLRIDYGDSIFYVERQTMPDGAAAPQYERIGTATLVDRRGYFLTASHTTKQSSTQTCDKKNVYPGLLRLRNEKGLTVFGREIGGYPDGKIDLALLRSEPADAPALQRLAVPNLMIGEPYYFSQVTENKRAALVAFAYNVTTLMTMPDYGALDMSTEPDQPLYLHGQTAYNGNSGGPVFTANGGAIVGLLIGPQSTRAAEACASVVRADSRGLLPTERMELTGLSSAEAKQLLGIVPDDPIAIALAGVLQGDRTKLAELNERFTNKQIGALVLYQTERILLRSKAQRDARLGLKAEDASKDDAEMIDLVDAASATARRNNLDKAALEFLKYCPHSDQNERCRAASVSNALYVAVSALKGASSDPKTKEFRQAAVDQLSTLLKAQDVVFERASPQLASSAYSALGRLFAADSRYEKQSEKLLARSVALDGANTEAKFALYQVQLTQGKDWQARKVGADLLADIESGKGPVKTADSYKDLSRVELKNRIETGMSERAEASKFMAVGQ